MPNIITHKIFAEEVLKEITKQDIKGMIDRHPQIFYIGSNGPDFLFFQHAKPWEAMKSHTLNHLGSAMHAVHINDFYRVAMRCIKEQKHPDVKEAMSVYLFGHLCHWALDMKTHPYIFYRTGNCKGVSAGYHHRFESMMDTMMLERYHNLSIRDYRAYEICEYDEDILRAISRIYVPVAKEVYHVEVKVHDIRETLNSWYDIQKLLYDPKKMKYKALKGVETIIRKPWMISGNVVRPDVEDRYDILNEEKHIWYHPCDDHISSNASFLELFNEAIKIANTVLEKAYGCVEYDADISGVMDILKDRAYDTGMDGEREMKYFDIIYEEAS
ncbi:zinc dependent phospholipase C family protein [[Eubacterium] hominis]|uniref:zinc dependent phospholipase C family protein n=1 Tax=[Eubacterium] hominis TaxID=2764325 RepID=UPI003A4E269E